MATSNKKLKKNRLFILLFVTLFIGSACSLLSPKQASANVPTATALVLPFSGVSTPTSIALPTQAPLTMVPTSTPLPIATPVPLQPSAT